MERKTFILFWAIFILAAPLSVINNLPVNFQSTNPVAVLSVLQRITGLTAFLLLTSQIINGKMMPLLTQKMGRWVFDFHLMQGALSFVFVLSHPLLLLLFYFVATNRLDPFFVFTDVCILCKGIPLYDSLGKIAFWMIMSIVVAGRIRNQPWWRKNWRIFHVLAYPAYLFAASHAYLRGSDATIFPFSIFFYGSVLIVAYIFINTFYNWFKENFRIK